MTSRGPPTTGCCVGPSMLVMAWTCRSRRMGLWSKGWNLTICRLLVSYYKAEHDRSTLIVVSAIHDWEWEDSAPQVSVLRMFQKKRKGEWQMIYTAAIFNWIVWLRFLPGKHLCPHDKSRGESFFHLRKGMWSMILLGSIRKLLMRRLRDDISLELAF